MQTSVLQTITLHRLPELQEELDARLADAIRDCATKPELKKPRKITLEITFTPSMKDPDDIVIAPRILMKLPGRPLANVIARRGRNNQLQFDFESEL